ncbi:MAG: zinc metalloprotease HtpX [Candidatus Hydrothermarchaeales archaeon]
MWLQLRLYFLVAIMFAIVYAIVSVVAFSMGIGAFWFYAILASVILLIQYMLGPKMVELSMRVRYVSEDEYPELHEMVAELASEANIPKPRVAVSQAPIPNAFAFGRWKSDGRVCVTEQIMQLLSKDELNAVLGHEISHLKHRDVAIITMLSVVPMICWYIAWSMIWSGGREDRDNTVLIGIVAFVLYFITNLLVLYGSRIREYYADKGSVELGNAPNYLATALYKLVYGSAKVSKRELKQMEGMKAFFANDPSRASHDIMELRDIDLDMSGTIDPDELEALRSKRVSISTSDKLMEILSTHPNMVKRIKHLSTLLT